VSSAKEAADEALYSLDSERFLHDLALKVQEALWYAEFQAPLRCLWQVEGGEIFA